MNNKINNISPLRYPGGKTRACKILDEILNKYFNVNDFDTIISPFFGGGSFEFFLQNKYNLEIIANDKFKPLYVFWKQCKINKINLYNNILKNKDITKENFQEFRNLILDCNDDLIQATYFFVINRCSFSGATLSGGFSLEASKKRFTHSSIDKIKKLDLAKFKIHNKDFNDFIKKYYTGEKQIMFLDPPYYLENKSNLYGNNGDMHENFNHKKLYKRLKNKKKWILTYNDCQYIRDLYKDYIIIETNWSYGMNKTKVSSEIIIISK